MSAIASQISGVPIVWQTVCSGVDQRTPKSSEWLAFVRWIHRWPVVSLAKGQKRRKSFHLMTSSWLKSAPRGVIADKSALGLDNGLAQNRRQAITWYVIKWKLFPRYWPFLRGIHRSPWRPALVFSLICAWINAWVNNLEAGELRRYRTHYDVTVVI